MPAKKVTVAEQAGVYPRRFADAMKKVRRSVKLSKKKNNETTQRKVVRGATNTGKVSGVILLWLLEMLARVVNVSAVNNPIIRAMERGYAKWPDINPQATGRDKNGKPKQTTKKRKMAADISHWSRQHPWVMSYLTYYAMMAGVILGGKSYVGADASAGDMIADQITVTIDDYDDGDDIVDIYDDNVDIIDLNQKIDPRAPDFYEKCRSIQDLTAFAVFYFETYRPHPVQQRGEKAYTRVFGMTWSPNNKGKMIVRNYVKTNKKRKEYAHKPVYEQSMDKDVEEAQKFLWDHDVYKNIKSNLKRPITVNQFIAICMASYQFPNHTSKICQRLNSAKTQQQIADAYMGGMKIKDGEWGGNIKRRWACAMLAIGKISLQDYMDAYVDGFYALGDDEKTYVKKGHFIIDDDLCRRSLQVRGWNPHKTSEYATMTEAGRRAIKQMGISETQMPMLEIAQDGVDITQDPSPATGKAGKKKGRSAFNRASKKLEKRAHSSDFDIGTVAAHDGYDLV